MSWVIRTERAHRGDGKPEENSVHLTGTQRPNSVQRSQSWHGETDKPCIMKKRYLAEGSRRFDRTAKSPFEHAPVNLAHVLRYTYSPSHVINLNGNGEHRSSEDNICERSKKENKHRKAQTNRVSIKLARHVESRDRFVRQRPGQDLAFERKVDDRVSTGMERPAAEDQDSRRRDRPAENGFQTAEFVVQDIAIKQPAPETPMSCSAKEHKEELNSVPVIRSDPRGLNVNSPSSHNSKTTSGIGEDDGSCEIKPSSSTFKPKQVYGNMRPFGRLKEVNRRVNMGNGYFNAREHQRLHPASLGSGEKHDSRSRPLGSRLFRRPISEDSKEDFCIYDPEDAHEPCFRFSASSNQRKSSRLAHTTLSHSVPDAQQRSTSSNRTINSHGPPPGTNGSKRNKPDQHNARRKTSVSKHSETTATSSERRPVTTTTTTRPAEKNDPSQAKQRTDAGKTHQGQSQDGKARETRPAGTDMDKAALAELSQTERSKYTPRTGRPETRQQDDTYKTHSRQQDDTYKTHSRPADDKTGTATAPDGRTTRAQAVDIQAIDRRKRQRSRPHRTPSEKPPSVSDLTEEMRRYVREKYPALQTRLYCVPPIHFNMTRRKELPDLNGVYVPDETPESSSRADETRERLIEVLKEVLKDRKAFVLSGIIFEDYLNKRLPVASSQLGKPMPVPLPKSADLPPQYRRGEAEILIIDKARGILIVDIKAVGDTFGEMRVSEAEAAELVRKVLDKAMTLMTKSRDVLLHLVSDIPVTIPVSVVLVLPNLKKAALKRTLDTHPALRKVLERCLTTRGPLTEACLCAEDLPPKHQAPTEDDIRHLTDWWDRHYPNGPQIIEDDVYETIIGRFCGPFSTITVWTPHVPKTEVRTLGQAVNETGNRFATLLLLPEQKQILDSPERRVYLTGPPGSGKTLVLVLKGVQWARSGCHVCVLSAKAGPSPIALVIQAQIHKILEQYGDSIDRKHVVTDTILRDHDGLRTDGSSLARRLRARTEGRSLCLILDELQGEVIPYLDELRRQMPEAFFWSSGAWPSICPAGFTRRELSTAVRCPPAVQTLLMMTEPSPKPPGDSQRPDPLYRYLTRSTQLTHNPLPTTGMPVMLLSHVGHGEKAITDCRLCAETLVDYLRKLKIGEEIDPGEVLILTADRKPLHRGFLSFDFVRGLVDSGLPIDIVQDYPGSQEKLAFPGNKITLTSFLFVCGLERKVVIFLPEGTAADNVPHTTGRAHCKGNQSDARTPHGEVPAPSWNTDAEVGQQDAEPALSNGGTRHLEEEVTQTNRTSVYGTVTEGVGMGTEGREMHPGKHEKLIDVQPAACDGRREEQDSCMDKKEAGNSSVEADNENIPEVYDGHLDGVGRVGRREASQKKTEVNREDPCLESREGKRQEASTENREGTRQETSTENREENGLETSTENREENRRETENREENKQEASTENRQEASTENKEENGQEAFQKNGEEDRRKDVLQDKKGTELSAVRREGNTDTYGPEKHAQLNSSFRHHDITNTEIAEEDSGSDCDTIASIENPSSGYESDDEQSSASEELSVKMGMPPFGVDSRFTEMRRREQHPSAGAKADDSATKGESNTDVFSDTDSLPSAPCNVSDAHDSRQETVHDDAYFSKQEASEKEEKDDAKSSEEKEDDSRNPSGPDSPQAEAPDQCVVVTNQPDGDFQSQAHATTATDGRGQKPVDVQSLNSRLQAAVESMSSTNKEVMWFSVSRALGHAVVFHF